MRAAAGGHKIRPAGGCVKRAPLTSDTLNLQGIQKSFGGVQALNGASVTCRRGRGALSHR